MDPLMIYILDERIPSSQLEDQLKKTQPSTKEQVVDLILSKINGKEETEFQVFTQKYEKMSFKYYSSNKKKFIYIKDLEELELKNQNKETWNDPKELKFDLLNTQFSFYKEFDKTILYNRQIEDWINTAAAWLVSSRKKEYLTLALDTLLISDTERLASISPKDSQEHIESPRSLGREPDEKSGEKETIKKVPEKWYALLHMIYVNMDKYKPFEDFSKKKFIVAYGKENYPIKGTGQMFYQEISRINDSKSIYNYIHTCVKKDFGKWKKIITEISENDPAIQLWIDRNKM